MCVYIQRLANLRRIKSLTKYLVLLNYLSSYLITALIYLIFIIINYYMTAYFFLIKRNLSVFTIQIGRGTLA